MQREEMVSLIDKGGALEKKMPAFEVREGQKQMLLDVARAFEENKTALLEAGTGTGKSIAYLIPTVFEALNSKQTTVISTHTISLQQQLIEKDIPFLLEALGLDLKVCLVKGMQNYLCRRRLEDAGDEESSEEIDQLNTFAAESEEGSRSDLPFLLQKETWEKVKAQKESCTFLKCPHFKKCFFFKARKNCENARILVVNHHLLFADLAARTSIDDPCILPPYRHIIIDEAHHVENVATDYLSKRSSRFAFQLILGRLLSDKKSGKLAVLTKKVDKEGEEKLTHKLSVDIPIQKQELLDGAFALFDTFAFFLIETREEKCRLMPQHLNSALWQEHVHPLTKELALKVKGFIASLSSINKEIKDPSILQKCEGVLADIGGILEQLEGQIETLNEFVFGVEQSNKVRWIERSERNLTVVEAKLDISEDLKKRLFEKFDSVVLSSATLTTNGEFSFIQNRLGIDNEPIKCIYDSPFDFATQAKLFVPLDHPAPNHPNFIFEAKKSIEKALVVSDGNAFVLFTSYTMLCQVKKLLAPVLSAKKMPLFCQADMTRAKLLEAFKNTPRSVLFGTDSFWEGVDVVGDKLKCVILVKLPFKVPTEPLLKARAEKIVKEGKSPFFEEALPAAVIKFKQGFGRLIRNQNDRGAIVCLDSRLAKKGYGKHFLKSLPPCPTLFDTSQAVFEDLKAFYAASDPTTGTSACLRSLSTESVMQASDQTLSAVSSISKSV